MSSTPVFPISWLSWYVSRVRVVRIDQLVAGLPLGSGDWADIAEQMRGRRAVGIAPHGALHDVHAGKLILAFAKKHEQLGVDVDCDGYPLERTVGTVAVLVDDVSDLGESPRATDGDGESQEHLVALDRVEVVDDPAVDRDHLGDLVVDDDPAVAVEDAAPRCLFVDLFEHVGLGPLLEFLALSLESLQVPQPGDEPAEQATGR